MIVYITTELGLAAFLIYETEVFASIPIDHDHDNRAWTLILDRCSDAEEVNSMSNGRRRQKHLSGLLFVLAGQIFCCETHPSSVNARTTTDPGVVGVGTPGRRLA